MQLEHRLECLGYYGFGGGWDAQNRKQQNRELYCNRCSFRKECWDDHRIRIIKVFPELTAEFDKLAAEKGGPEAVGLWHAANNMLDPYSLVMMTNIEDGHAAAAGTKPKDRGVLTLPYPFTKG